MPIINSEIALILTWNSTCVIVASNVAKQNATFTITDTKLYVPVVTLSTYVFIKTRIISTKSKSKSFD